MRLFFYLFCLLSFLLSGCRQYHGWNHDGPLVFEERPINTAPSPIIEEEKPISREEKPVVKAEKSPLLPVKVIKLEKVVIDAGHGGKDTGAHSEKNHYLEKQLTLQTARLVQQYLNEMGYQTFLTRDTDEFIELSSRAEFANSLKADLFVSVHYNYCSSPEVEGIEVYYHKGDKNSLTPRLSASKCLGQEVLARVIKHTGAQSRGVKTANFAVIRETQMPAILVECGFLSNPEEREKIKDTTYRCYLAWAIARGVDVYLTTNRK